MTIQEFFNSGSEVQCKVVLRRWSNEKEDYTLNKTIFDAGGICIHLDFKDKLMDAEIKYIYIVDNSLILEIAEKDG